MGLRHMGPGCEQLAYVAANPQTPPSRPPKAKIPLFFHPERGSPFQMEEQGGGPQEIDGFCPSCGWLVSDQDVRLGRRRAGPPPQASFRATHPTLEISGQLLRVHGLLSGDLEALPATHRTCLLYTSDAADDYLEV